MLNIVNKFEETASSNPFLLIRHAPGGGGKFLMSVLMASSSIAHFDSTIEQNKTDKKCLDYIKEKFTSNIDDWLKIEPDSIDAWNLHFISTKYPRGETLDIDQFINLANSEATNHYHNSLSRKKLICMSWLKLSVPEYFIGAKNIVIIVDKKSMRWLHRAHWYKHYAVSDRGIHLKINDPKYHHTSTMVSYARKFNNPIYLLDSPRTFIKENIINCGVKKIFSEPDNFKNLINKCYVNLSDIIDENSFINLIKHITKNLNLHDIDQTFVRNAHKHWISCHNFKYAKNS
jgi:hypothetical protein